MLTEAERLKAEAKTIEDQIVELEKEVEIGKSAERLSVHPDWKRYCERIKVGIESKEGLTLSQYRLILDPARTTEEKLQALEKARVYDSMIQQVMYLITLVDREAARGVEAAKELQTLKERRDKNA